MTRLNIVGLLAAALCVTVTGSLCGAEAIEIKCRTMPPPEARQAFDAVKTSNGDTISYSCTWERPQKYGVYSGKSYFLERANRIKWERSEVIDKFTVAGYCYELPSLSIRNDTGSWEIINRIAIKFPEGPGQKMMKMFTRAVGAKMEGQVKKTTDAATALETIIEIKLAQEPQAYEDTYTGEEFERNGQKLWRLSRQTSPAKVGMIRQVYQSIAAGEGLELLEDAPKTDARKAAKIMTQQLAKMTAREEIVVNCADLLIVEERRFASDGKLLKESVIQNVRRENLDESFFQLPEGCERREPQTLMQYARVSGEARQLQKKAYREAERLKNAIALQTPNPLQATGR